MSGEKSSSIDSKEGSEIWVDRLVGKRKCLSRALLCMKKCFRNAKKPGSWILPRAYASTNRSCLL